MLNYPINVTIDTNALYATKYDLSEGSPLALLKSYVEKGQIKVVLSNIVIREAKKHIAEQVSGVCSIARNARTDALEKSTFHLIEQVGLGKVIELINSKEKNMFISKAIELFEKFIEEADTEILENSLIDLDKIIDDYFEIKPPFENGEKKRKEFPDAFIVSQIMKRFGENEKVAIVSNDNGFKKACGNKPNYTFYNDLSSLYHKITEESEAFEETLSVIENLKCKISSKILKHIEYNENIDVRGVSYDNDGIVDGFDYIETNLFNITNLSFKVHYVDEINNTSSIITLSCKADISVDCFYEDYDNASWDSENEEYIFLDTIKMREEHKARFACRIELDRKTRKFEIFPFVVVLGVSSRKDRYKVDEEFGFDYEKEIEDMDRENLGFISLGSYDAYLEENLPESDFVKDIMEIFEEMNGLYGQYESFYIVYDSFLEKFNDKVNKKELANICSKFKETAELPVDCESEELLKKWVEEKCDFTYKISEYSLPDILNYGDKITINGVDNTEMVLLINEIVINPSPGSEEEITLKLKSAKKDIANGFIKLTVGYLNFDEDGGAADGMEDSIEYEYSEIIDKLNEYIAEQKKQVEIETKIVSIIESVL